MSSFDFDSEFTAPRDGGREQARLAWDHPLPAAGLMRHHGNRDFEFNGESTDFV